MTLLRRILAWLRRGRLQTDLRDELAQHIEWRTESLIADGLPEAEARRQAAVSVGNVTKLQEEARAVWGFPSLDSIAQDIRYGARLLWRSPAFTTVAVMSLAIGIGSS